MSKVHVTEFTVTDEIEDRFWSRVAINIFGCWLWQGPPRHNGYGELHIWRKTRRAHVVAYYLATGIWPGKLRTLHTCDVRNCCNPLHLYLGTDADNSADMVARGRQAKGEKNGTRTHPESVHRGEQCNLAKLTEEQVKEIRRLRASGRSMCSIAKQFKLVREAVRKIVNRETWAHVP